MILAQKVLIFFTFYKFGTIFLLKKNEMKVIFYYGLSYDAWKFPI